MSTAKQIWSEAFGALSRGSLRKAFKSLARVPDCPQCKGNGTPNGGFSTTVYWRGELTVVCGTCDGSGKV